MPNSRNSFNDFFYRINSKYHGCFLFLSYLTLLSKMGVKYISSFLNLFLWIIFKDEI